MTKFKIVIGENVCSSEPARNITMARFILAVAILAVHSEAFQPTFLSKPILNDLKFQNMRGFEQRGGFAIRNGFKMNGQQQGKDWEAVKDPKTGDTYWYNPKTLETTWDSPTIITVESPTPSIPKPVKEEASPFSPQAAASTFEIMTKFTQKLTEYKACTDSEKRRTLRLEILELYTEFAIPSLSLAIGTIITFPGAFAFFFVALQASGRGLADIQALFASVPFVADALSHIDPSLGTAAIAAVAVELVSPLLLLAAVAIKGTVEAGLRERLPQLGLDASGMAKRLDALAGGGEADLF
jgi:hypothetical protein